MSRPETPRLNISTTALVLGVAVSYPALFWVARLDPARAMVTAVPLGLLAGGTVWASDFLFEVVQRWQPNLDPTESLSGAIVTGVLVGLVLSVPIPPTPTRPSLEAVVFSIGFPTLCCIGVFGLCSAYRGVARPSSQTDEHS
ncbi:hypothetical protein [Halovenus halobia]|uniref:hypothetical protein n=1 Tax=Halovenus halobia TaxID=3396622 RepID=UPI003F561F23